MGQHTSAEHTRLQQADEGTAAWRGWGPYLSERAWGTVREDYSAYGEAWDYFPHDHARSRVYRWNEDGMAGISDEHQTFCLALALWNGIDPILKERMFGLTGPEGNHGEDVKDYWWYLDSTPTHSWMSWRYHYPQREFPYADLVDTNARRGKLDPEYELVDTGAFADDRFWAVHVDYAKAAPDDLLMRVRVTNHGVVGTKAAIHHVLTGPAGETREVRVRLCTGDVAGELGGEFDDVMAARKAEADDYYSALLAGADVDEALVARQAFAGMLWC